MSLRDLIEETKKRLNQGASNFKGNVQAIANPNTRQDWMRGANDSMFRFNQTKNPITVLGNRVAQDINTGGERFGEAIFQAGQNRRANKPIFQSNVTSPIKEGLLPAARAITFPVAALNPGMTAANLGLGYLGGGREGFAEAGANSGLLSTALKASNPIANKVVSSPLVSRTAGKLPLGEKGAKFLASRAVPAAANVAQGIGLDRGMGYDTTALSVGIDAITGLAGGKGQFNTIGKGAVPTKRGFDNIISNEKRITEVLNRYNSQFERGRTPDKADTQMVELAEETWKRIFGRNKKPPVSLGETVGDLHQALEGAKTEMLMQREGYTLGIRGKAPSQPTKGVEANQKVKLPELDNLLNYPRKLEEMGYRPEQIDKISAKEAKKIFDENIPPFVHKSFSGPENIKIKNDPVKMADGTYSQFEPTKQEVDERVLESILDEPTGVKSWYNKIFNPIKNAPEEVQNIMGNWRKENMVARAKANQVAEMFADIPEQDGLKLIKYMQDPTAKNAKNLGIDPGQYNKQIGELRKFYDTTRQEGLSAGLDIKYLDNYLNQIWKESPSQINAKIRAGAGKTPGFTKSREIPSYQEGINLGLTPKFTHPAQLAAHYRYQLDKAISNSKMTDSLIKSKTLLPGNKAPADWKAIDSPFFPKSSVKAGNKTIVTDYKAPPAVARVLNNIFEVSEPGLMSKAAGLSRAVQEFALSAGIPKTPFNSFTLANLNKEIVAGRIRGPAVASAVSLTDSGTKKYFKANSDVIQEMASEGIPTYTNTDYTSMYKNLLENKNIWGRASDTFNSWFNEPTFKRFMPALQIEFFKDAKKSALDSGMDAASARKAAAQATINFYGLTDNFSRSQFTDDTLAAGIMAPRFREAMMGFWTNNLKALNPKNLKDPAYAANRKFLVGATVTYGLYNMLNYAINGNFMWDNKDGKELSLEIPQGNGRSFFIPLLPTISTVPRRFVEGAGYLASGDIAGATERMSTFGSIPLQTGSSLLTNRTFYGGPIYDEEDPAYSKVGKLAGYGFEQIAHPWLGEPMAVAQGRKSVPEAIPGLLEVPAYPSTSSDQAHLRGASLAKYKELQAASPASAQAYSDRIKSERAMKESGKNIKIKDEEPGFISRLFGAKARGPDLDTASAYFGLGEYNELPSGTAMQRATKEAEKKKIVGKILSDEDVDNEMKAQVLSNLGVNYTPEDIDYYQVAKEENSIKLGYVMDELQQSDDPLNLLVSLRKEVNGKVILAPGVIDSLVDEGVISKAEGKWLKDFKYGEGVKQSKSVKKGKKAKKPAQITIKSTVKPSLRMFNIKAPKIDEPSVALPRMREGAIMAAIGSRPEPIRIKA